MRHPIPREALDDRLGFIGTSGSGKTYNAGTAIEILLGVHKARVVIIDPLGVWWGLRLLADGKKDSNFNVVIFGGGHADLPLNEQAGALIGETAATMAESCILDLSGMPSRAAERRFMNAFLETIYRKASGEPFHLVVDEADLFAPQNPQKGDEALLGHMDNIVRRGRVKGFIPWLISQRPAVLNKNVLSQVDGLLAFKLTASQDRDALDAWIEGQADKAQGKAIKDALPTFQVGEGVVWLPGHGILERRPFPAKVTFDSSRKPKRGEKLKSRKLKPLNVGKLKEQLASVVEEAKANDPKELRKQVADLKAQLFKAEKATPIASVDKPAEKKAAADREAKAHIRGKVEGYGEALKAVGAIFRDLAPTIAKLEPLVEAIKANGQAIEGWSATIKEKQAELAKQLPPSGSPTERPSAHAPIMRAPSGQPPVVARKPSPAANGDGTLSNSERKILDAIRWWNVLGIAAPSHAQVAFIAGYSHKSGTWATYLSRLRSSGMIEGRGDLVFTESGLNEAREPDAVPSRDALWTAVLGKIDAPLQKILKPIIAAYPDGMTHASASEEAGYSSASGTWATYLSRLRSLDLIEGRGELKAQGWLFP
ncbi:MAG: hypothetical protein JWP25_3590 [Bradyrhizobium sp.]|nr:hypothetical protein [Bradyrhizobium sp.]